MDLLSRGVYPNISKECGLVERLVFTITGGERASKWWKLDTPNAQQRVNVVIQDDRAYFHVGVDVPCVDTAKPKLPIRVI